MLRAQSRLVLRPRLLTPQTTQKAPISSSSLKPAISARLNPASRPSARGRDLPSVLPSSSSISSRNMSTHYGESAARPDPDKVVQDIADYVHGYNIESDLAYETARLCLIDTIGCGLEGLRFEECRRLLGPVVEGTVVPNGAQISWLYSFPALTSFPAFQGPRCPGPITNSIPSVAPSILAQSFVGSTSTTAFWLPNVNI